MKFKTKRIISLLFAIVFIFSMTISVSAEIDPRMVFYTVSYNMNGGVGTISSQSKPEGITIYLSTTVPTRENYIFCGWSTSANSNQTAQYYCGDAYSNNKNVVLYAVWKPFAYNNGDEYTDTFYYPYDGGVPGTPTDWCSWQCDAFAREAYYTVNDYYIPAVAVLKANFTPIGLTTSNLRGYLDMVGAGAYVRGYYNAARTYEHSLYILSYTSSTVTIMDANWIEDTVVYTTLSYAQFISRINMITCYYSRL